MGIETVAANKVWESAPGLKASRAVVLCGTIEFLSTTGRQSLCSGRLPSYESRPIKLRLTVCIVWKCIEHGLKSRQEALGGLWRQLEENVG